jgi:hypothetical protein
VTPGRQVPDGDCGGWSSTPEGERSSGASPGGAPSPFWSVCGPSPPVLADCSDGGGGVAPPDELPVPVAVAASGSSDGGTVSGSCTAASWR